MSRPPHRPVVWRPFVLAACCLAFLSPQAMALIEVGRGNSPVPDGPWPDGTLQVANLKSRIGWWEGPPFGGGHREFLYRGDTAALNEALKAFGQIRTPVLDLFVHDGIKDSTFLKDPKDPKADTRADWTFDVWIPASWHRLYNNPKGVFASEQPEFRRPVDPPRMHVYLGRGTIAWEQVKVPPTVRLTDRRAIAKDQPPAGLVAGAVYDMATGKTIPKAQVTLGKLNEQGQWEKVAEAQSADDGRFEITKAPENSRRLTIAAEGYAPRSVDLEQLSPGRFEAVSVELCAVAQLTGTVTDDDGKPLETVRVRADSVMGIDGRGYAASGRNEAVTDAQGRFELVGLPTGFTQLRFIKKGFYTRGPVFEIHEAPKKDLTFRMSGTATVRGKVIDKNGKPLVGTVINVNPQGESIGKWGGSKYTHPDGTFEFTDVPPGVYYVSTDPMADMAKNNPNAKKATLTPGMTVEVELVGR